MKLKRVNYSPVCSSYIIDDTYDKYLDVWYDYLCYIERVDGITKTYHFECFDDFFNWYENRGL